MTQTTQAKLQDKIIAKAQAEPEFRAQLVADPRTTIEGLSGLEFPATISIQVHEDSATSFHLVLPPSGQLTEDELATVFAGNWVQATGEFFGPPKKRQYHNQSNSDS